jgi:hypothetical protein
MSRLTSIVKIRSASEQALALVQSEFANYHPLISLARLAHRSEVMADPKLELEVHKCILPYVTPKLSSVEVKEEATDDRRVIVSLFEPMALDNGNVIDVEIPLVSDTSDIYKLD